MTAPFPTPAATFTALGIAIDRDSARCILAALAAEGPVLLYGAPGTAKSTLARAVGERLAPGRMLALDAALGSFDDVRAFSPQVPSQGAPCPAGSGRDVFLVVDGLARARATRQSRWLRLSREPAGAEPSRVRWLMASVDSPAVVDAPAAPHEHDDQNDQICQIDPAVADRFMAAVMLDDWTDLTFAQRLRVATTGAAPLAAPTLDLPAHVAAIRAGAAAIRADATLHSRIASAAVAAIDAYHASETTAVRPGGRRAHLLSELLVHLYASVALEFPRDQVEGAFEASTRPAIAFGVQPVGYIAGHKGADELAAMQAAIHAAKQAFNPVPEYDDTEDPEDTEDPDEDAPNPPTLSRPRPNKRKAAFDRALLGGADVSGLSAALFSDAVLGHMRDNWPSPRRSYPVIPACTTVIVHALDRGATPPRRVATRVSLREVIARNLMSVGRALEQPAPTWAPLNLAEASIDAAAREFADGMLVKAERLSITHAGRAFVVPVSERLIIHRHGGFTRVGLDGATRALTDDDDLAEWDGAVLAARGPELTEGPSPFAPVAIVLPEAGPGEADLFRRAGRVLDHPGHIVPTVLSCAGLDALEALPVIASRQLHAWLVTRSVHNIYHPATRPQRAQHAQPIVVHGGPAELWDALSWPSVPNEPESASEDD